MAHNEMMKNAWENPNTKSWWCSPIYKVAKRDYRRFVSWFKNAIEPGKALVSELRVELRNGSTIEFYGMDKAENIEGEGLDFLYVDECGNIKDKVWNNTLQPMLIDRGGRALCFGTPKGKNWFYRLFGYGQDKNHKRYRSWQYPSITNPYADKEEIKKAYDELPELVYRQEYQGEFIDNEGAVFRGFMSCIDNSISIDNERPIPSRHYRGGLDLAKHIDYTVLTIRDIKTNRIVAIYRWNQYDWGFQEDRIQGLAKYWNDMEITIDVMSVGDNTYDKLKKSGVYLIPYKFSNQTKADLIENLMILLETRSIAIPANNDLLKELGDFEYEKLPSGKLRYNAPDGHHDDCVISLALACWDSDKEPVTAEDFKVQKSKSVYDIM